MLNLALISRADWSQQGFSLEEVGVLVWSAPGCWLQEEVLDIRELQSIFLSYVDKDLIFLGHFSYHWIIATDWPVKKKTTKFFTPKGFPGGVWNLRVSNSHINLSSLYQMSVQSNQTNKSKPNQNFTGVTLQMKQKAEMPRNQKPSNKSAPKRW